MILDSQVGKDSWDTPTPGLDDEAFASQDLTPSMKKDIVTSKEAPPINSDDGDGKVSPGEREHKFNAIKDDQGSRIRGGRGTDVSNTTEFIGQIVGMSQGDQSPMDKFGPECKIDGKSPYLLDGPKVEQSGKKPGVLVNRSTFSPRFDGSRFSSDAVVKVGAVVRVGADEGNG